MVGKIKNKIVVELDDCIENLRSIGITDKMIALNLATASELVKSKKWDEYYTNMK